MIPPKTALRLLSLASLALGVLSCDVRDKGTEPNPGPFVTLVPRLVKVDGGKVDSVDSVRIEVKVGDKVLLRSVDFRDHHLHVDSIPANTPWTLTVRGVRKAADGLHWPVWWEGSHSGDGKGSESLRLDTVEIVGRDTVPPSLAESGLPAGDPPVLPFGRTHDTLRFRFPSTDSVFNDSALHPVQTSAGISTYVLVFPVPNAIAIKVVDSAKKVTLATFRYTVAQGPQETARPVVTWLGRYADGDTIPFRTESWIASWRILETDTLTSVQVNGSPLKGTRTGKTDYLYSDTILLRKASKGYDTTLSLLATGKDPSDTTRSIAVLHVLPDTSRPVISGVDSLVVPYGTTGWKATWTATDLDTIVSMKVVATANNQAVENSPVRTGNSWTDSFSLASSPLEVELTATDSAGNSTTRKFTIRVAGESSDRTPPRINEGQLSKRTMAIDWDTRTVAFAWTITDNVAMGTAKIRGKTLLSAGSGTWLDTEAVHVGLDTFILAATDTSGNTSWDTTIVERATDTTTPEAIRSATTRDTLLLSKIDVYDVAWTVTDNGLQSVEIGGAQATRTGNVWSRNVSLYRDSLWIKLVAVDSCGNDRKDSILVRRLAPPAIYPSRKVLGPNGSVNPVFESNLHGATFQYSIDKKEWFQGDNVSVTTSQILWVRAIVDGLTSEMDSAIYLYSPAFDQPSGGLPASSRIAISAKGSPAIEYSLGSSSSWTRYSEPIPLEHSTIVYARSSLGDLTTSNVVATYAVSPTITPQSGSQTSPFQPSVVDAGADRIEVTTDSTQGWTSTLPSSITDNTTVWARSILGTSVSPPSLATWVFPHDTALSQVVVNGQEVTHRDAAGNYITDSLHLRTSELTISARPNSDNATVTILSSVAAGTTATAVTTMDSDSMVVEIKVTNGSVERKYDLIVLRRRSPEDLVDLRDNRRYPTTRIGNQIWMAANLNWMGAVGQITQGTCYDDQPIHCTTYGRLYTWSEAMAGGTASASSPSGVQGICPDGWHLPSGAEWDSLAIAIDGFQWKSDPAVANALKVSGTLWPTSGLGDTLGFSALPAGYGLASEPTYAGGPSGLGSPVAVWWTSSESTSSSTDAVYRLLGTATYNTDWDKQYQMSVRCVKD